MLSVISYSFNAIAPILILIIIGYTAKRTGFLNDATVKQMNRFNFRFCFLPLMIKNLYDLKGDFGIPWMLIGIVILSLCVITVAGYFVTKAVTRDKKRIPVLMMSSYRSNFAIIGIALCESLAGAEGLPMCSVFQLPNILFFNILSVSVLSIFSEESKGFDIKRILRSLITNPIMIGLFIGSVILIARGFIPKDLNGDPVFTIKKDLPWLFTALSYMARTATPLALVILGAQMNFEEIGSYRKELVVGVVFRLIVAPLIGFGIAFAAHATGLITFTPGTVAMMVAAYGTPMAVSSVVMCSEMGAEEKLAGQIVVWSSILSMISLFAICAILRAMGLL